MSRGGGVHRRLAGGKPGLANREPPVCIEISSPKFRRWRDTTAELYKTSGFGFGGKLGLDPLPPSLDRGDRAPLIVPLEDDNVCWF